ncbi:MAG: ABC transporter ATP-binding protein [Acidobacteriota bacterium]
MTNATTSPSSRPSRVPVRASDGDPGDPPRPVLTIRGLGLAATAASPGGAPFAVVRDVDLEVAAGESVGLVGDSGSGKTMTALAAMGVLPAGIEQVGGSVRVDGARAPAMIFQEPRSSLNPLLSVGYQIGEVLRLKGLRGRAVRRAGVDLLRRVAMPDPDERYRAFPHELSGGQCQRVSIAMALAAEPAVLIADEPTTALDVSVQAQVLRLLDTLRREEGLALWLITHDLALVAATCERVAVMDAGRIVEQGGRRQVFDDPAAPATRRLIEAARGEG